MTKKNQFTSYEIRPVVIDKDGDCTACNSIDEAKMLEARTEGSKVAWSLYGRTAEGLAEWLFDDADYSKCVAEYARLTDASFSVAGPAAPRFGLPAGENFSGLVRNQKASGPRFGA